MANSGDIRGKSSRYGVFGDTWQLGKNPGGEVFRSGLGTRGGFRGRFEEGFRRDSRQGFGDIVIFEGVFRLNLRDTWRVPKEGPKGLVRRRVGRGFRKNGFRDRWQSPKDG